MDLSLSLLPPSDHTVPSQQFLPLPQTLINTSPGRETPNNMCQRLNSISLNGNSCSAESINKYICSGLGISWARSLCDNWYKSNNGKESGFKIQPSFNHPENPLEELTDGTSHFVFFLIRTLNTVPASRKVISNGSSEGKGRLQVEKICKPLYFDTNWLLSHYFKSPGYGDILYLRGNFGKQKSYSSKTHNSSEHHYIYLSSSSSNKDRQN